MEVFERPEAEAWVDLKNHIHSTTSGHNYDQQLKREDDTLIMGGALYLHNRNLFREMHCHSYMTYYTLPYLLIYGMRDIHPRKQKPEQVRPDGLSLALTDDLGRITNFN